MIKIKCKDINKKEVKGLAKKLGLNDIKIIVNEVDDPKRKEIANYHMTYKTIDHKQVKIIKEKIQVFLYKEYPIERRIINYSGDTISKYEFKDKLEELTYSLAHEAYHRKYYQENKEFLPTSSIERNMRIIWNYKKEIEKNDFEEKEAHEFGMKFLKENYAVKV